MKPERRQTALGGPPRTRLLTNKARAFRENALLLFAVRLGLTIKPLKKEQFTTGLHREVFSCHKWPNRPRWHHLCLVYRKGLYLKMVKKPCSEKGVWSFYRKSILREFLVPSCEVALDQEP